MPLTNANLLTEGRLARWLIENSPVKLQIARVWPFVGVAGGQFDLRPGQQRPDARHRSRRLRPGRRRLGYRGRADF